MLLTNTIDPYRPILDDELSRERFPPLYLLVLEGHERSRYVLQKLAKERNFIVSGARDVSDARAIMKRQAVDLLVLDPTLRSDRRESFFEEVKALHPETNTIVLTAVEGLPLAIDAVKNGAIDYITKPISRETVASVLDRSRQQLYATIRSRRLREHFRVQKRSGKLIGHSSAMQQLRQLMVQVSRSRNTILVTGEPGAGKQLVARAIHFEGQNAATPLVSIECRSLSRSLRGSELFGHSKGAFQGVHYDQTGLLTHADKGTIVLDGVSDLTMEVQAELANVLRDGVIRPVGSKHLHRLAVRVIATTSRDIATLVERGRFRRDLYTLLNITNVQVPSLRDRFDDIRDLSVHFVNHINRYSRMNRLLSEAALEQLQEYSWPGNVRELENAIEYACFHGTEDTIRPRDLPVSILATRSREGTAGPSSEFLPSSVSDFFSVGRTMGDIEKQAILSTLDYTGGDVLEAAKILQLGKTTLYRKLKEYGTPRGESLAHA
jgi:DNA-binding NtrC family response regulator